MKVVGVEHGVWVVEFAVLAVGNLPRQWPLIVPQTPLIRKGKKVVQEVPAAAAKVPAVVDFGHRMAAGPRARCDTGEGPGGGANDDVVRQDPARQCSSIVIDPGI